MSGPNLVGRLVGGHYEVVEKLADGGQSEIFWGRNLKNGGQDVAIKAVGAGQEDPFASDRLHHEGTVLALLQNTPGCARLIERQFTSDGHLVLMLDLLDGMTLESILERGERRVEVDEIIDLFAPVVESLALLHRYGIIHRNIHPGKLFRSWDPPGLKLTGFGDSLFTRHTVARKAERFTGLLKYAAPEVWLGETEIDERADVYSLAVVLFRCLSGRCPFEGDSSVELVRVVPRVSHPLLTELRPGLPSALDDWASIALCPERSGRFDNVSAMWAAFERACRDAAALASVEAAEQARTG